MLPQRLLLPVLLLSAILPSHAQSTFGTRMDYGPVYMCSVLFPLPPGEKQPPMGTPKATPEELARMAASKGLVLRLGEKGDVCVCYDLETMKLVAAWTGGWLDLNKTNVAVYKGFGSGAAEIVGTLLPIEDNTPADARYLGLHRTSTGYALRYTAGGKTFIEKPSVRIADGKINIERETTEAGAPLAPAPTAWPAITLAGKRSTEQGAYVVDTVSVPKETPWNSWIRPSGFDFFPDGRAVLCTLGGEVWIVSGIDDSLEKVTWKRFATGLYEPLGLIVMDGMILVRARDQIVRLHDENGDGEADFYECVNSEAKLWPSYHAFVFDLQRDSHGSIYYITGGNSLPAERPWYARLYRMQADGTKREEVASGFRAPNGLTIAPDDSIRVSDNQGHWVPSSKISRIRPGGFYGHVADPRIDPNAPAPATYDAPLLFIPMTWDSSSGGGAFCTSDRWGPLRGRMVHTSFANTTLFLVLEDGQQAAAVPFGLKFDSGILRARFAPHDGQLYVCGLKGWQTRATQEGCLERVRYTGAPVRYPISYHVQKTGIALTFAEPLDRASAEDVNGIALDQWNYLWHATYGSPDISVADPKKKARDTVDVKAARLSADGKKLLIEYENVQPVMQFLLKLSAKFADGTPLDTQLAGTINEVPQ